MLFGVVGALLLLAVNGFMIGRPTGLVHSATSARFLFGLPEPPKNPLKKDGGGIFGNMGNMMETMKKAQEIAKMGESLNKELQEMLITGSDPSGQVSATFTGMAAPIAVKVSESILSQGAEAVSLATTQAIIDGHQKSSQTMMTKMQALYSQFGLPMPAQK